MAADDVKFRVSVDTGAAPQKLNELGQAVDRVTKDADEMAASGRNAASSTDRLGASANAASGLVKNLAASIAAGFTFQQLVQAGAQFESIKVGLQAVTGSAEAAGAQMDFVRQVATRTGSDINEVGRAFLGLAAATKGTAVEGEPTRQVFEAVAASMAKAGKSSAETQNALVALAQIASKGTVSMEELRGQLGEALPGALQAAAKGLGITTQDLIKMVEQGEIAAEDLFPALSKGLNDLYGGGVTGAQTLAQEITNIKNAFTELAADLGEAGGFDALKSGAEIAQTGIVLLNDALVTVGKTIGVLTAAAASVDFSGVTEAFSEIERESRDKLLKAAKHNQTLAAYIGAVGNEATKAALSQQQAAAATKAAGESAAGAAGTYTSLGAAYKKVTQDVTEQIEAAEKSRAAREAEGKASIQLAQAFGTEAERRKAAAAAAATDAAELARLAQLRLTDVNVLRAELDAKRALLDQGGPISDQRKKELEELQKKIELRQSDADKAVAQAQAARLAAEAAKAESDAQKDNSARVNELREAYASAHKALEAMRAAKAAGVATTEQLTQAEINAGKAATLYRDALADQTRTLKAKADATQAAMSLQEIAIKVEMERQRATIEVATALGDEKTAIAAGNELRRLEIELLMLTAEAKRAESKARLAEIEIKRAELIASGNLTEAQKAELKALEAKAQVLNKEAEIAEITAGKLERLANITQASGNASRTAAAGHYEQADGLNALAAASDRAAEAERRRLNVDKNGFSTDKDGKTIAAGGDLNTRTGIFNYLKAAGVTDDDEARRITSEFADGQGNIPFFDNPGQLRYGGAGSTISQALLKAAEQFTFGGGARKAGTEPTKAPGQPSSAGGGSSTPVNITINGTRRTVNVASAGDAGTLQTLLQQLANESGRT